VSWDVFAKKHAEARREAWSWPQQRECSVEFCARRGALFFEARIEYCRSCKVSLPWSPCMGRCLTLGIAPEASSLAHKGGAPQKMWSEVGGEEVINLVGSMSRDKYTYLCNASVYLHSFLLSRSTPFTTPPHINAPRASKLGKRKCN
jgi:hypothetical protein